MAYKFKYQLKALDFWKLSMYSMYRSMIGVCNIIFTVAMIGVAIKFWGQINLGMKTILVFISNLFIIIQPISIYLKARKHIALLPKDMELGFDEIGIHINTKNQISELRWETIKGIIKKPNMIIILSTTKQGFILTNRILGMQKDALYNYVSTHL